MSLRVLHVTSYFAPAFVYGGPPRSILGLCQGLIQAGLEVEVFTTTANGEGDLPAGAEAGQQYEGVPVRYFPLSFPQRWFGSRGLREALTRHVTSYDLVHVHGLWTLPSGMAARTCAGSNVPYVVSPRGMLDAGSMRHHRWRKEAYLRLRERRNLARAAFLHATSAAEKASIELRSSKAPVVVVPNGVSVDRSPRRGFLRARGISESTPAVVFLGRLHPTKRIDLLLAAFSTLRKSHPGATLVIAGRADGVEPGRNIRGTNVYWAGHLEEDEKWSLLGDASVLVSCSDSESFGLSVLEALSVGVPVVVTRTCPWEDVERYHCGYWVEQSPAEIAHGIAKILDDPQGAHRMGERGRELISSQYSWTKIGLEMAHHYSDAIEKRRLTLHTNLSRR